MITAGARKDEARLTRGRSQPVIPPSAFSTRAHRCAPGSRTVPDRGRAQTACANAPAIPRCGSPARSPAGNGETRWICSARTGWRNVQDPARHGRSWTSTSSIWRPFGREGYSAAFHRYIRSSTRHQHRRAGSILGRPSSTSRRGSNHHRQSFACPLTSKNHRWVAPSSAPVLAGDAELRSARPRPMLSMIEWWICCRCPPDRSGEGRALRDVNPAQKALMLSRAGVRQVSEGVICRSRWKSVRAVPRASTGHGDDRPREKASAIS